MISVIMPTYGRREQAENTLHQLMRTLDDRSRIIVVVDNNDLSSYEAHRWSNMSLLMDCHVKMEHYGPVANWNYGVTMFDADYFIMAGDDIHFPKGWLDNALDWYKPGHLLSLADGQRPLATHYMMDKQAMTDILGGVLCVPHYFSQYLDIEATQRARDMGRLILPDQPIFEHRHPAFGTAPRDATHAIGTAWKRKDQKVYQDRKAHGFPNDYEAII